VSFHLAGARRPQPAGAVLESTGNKNSEKSAIAAMEWRCAADLYLETARQQNAAASKIVLVTTASRNVGYHTSEMSSVINLSPLFSGFVNQIGESPQFVLRDIRIAVGKKGAYRVLQATPEEVTHDLL